ncbi:MAG: aminotransferase class V-fold PLP-dependent enzyme, partial [Treponema sp.]|nr:aminotransferase class V-fold PLP-dependent enzyme [Treponema sp.]
MNTPSSQYNPADYGLPSEAELAAQAGAYFPELNRAEGGSVPGAITPETAAAPAFAPELPAAGAGLPWPGAAAGLTPFTVTDTVAGLAPSYRPTVLPKDAEQAAGLPGQPAAPSRNLHPGLPLDAIRADFPILSEKVNGHDLVWLDNAATTQRPRAVIERLQYYYEHENSNVHRGAHELAARSTDAYEDARGKVARFLGAPSADNIVFVRGTTEGINLAAQAYVKQYLNAGDEIILTILEHHANIVPWQIIAEETGAVLRVAPIDRNAQIILSEYTAL